MSIFFDFEIGPRGRRFRKAVQQDRTDVELLMNQEETKEIFGDLDIGSLIELAVLSICMINKDNEVLGFMCLNDHPNILGVDPSDWEIWIRNMFQKYYTSRNTLFIHCACCKESVIEYFLEEALLSAFQNDTYLLQILLFVTADCNVDHLLRNQTFKKRKMYKHLTRRTDDSDARTHYMYVALREDYCPKLHIRRAVEEDNDDIVKILGKTCPRLREMYGDFYISELIGSHPEDKRKIIVAESQERAVGVMCLTPDINYRKLQNLYELKPWYGLKKATPLEKEQNSRMNVLLTVYGDPIMQGEWGPFDEPPQLGAMLERKNRESQHRESQNRDSQNRVSQNRESQKRVSQNRVSQNRVSQNRVSQYRQSQKRVSQNRESQNRELQKGESIDDRENVGKVIFKEESGDMDHVIYHDSNDFSDGISLTSYASKMSTELLLEEDPFDYEIVNIDKELLTVPEALSCQTIASHITISEKQRFSDENEHGPLPKIKRKPQHRFSIQNQKTDFQIYHGEPNAFSIELFGLREDIDPRSAFDLLEVAFEVMKEFDYCIIRVPSSEKSFPLLQHFCYVPIKQRICCSYSLYVAHRSSVLGKLRVRVAEFTDIPMITRLLQKIQYKETICTIEHSILKRDERNVYVFMCGTSVIGLGILELPDQLNFIRMRYCMEPYHYHNYHLSGQDTDTGFSCIKAMIVYPAFEAHYRFFARELMRLSDSHSLIWMTAYRNKWVAHKANSIASSMIPLVPRKTIVEVPPVPELRTLSIMEKKILPFSTWFIDKKLTSVPVVNVSTRIVLIGSSRTAMAFINALMFDQSNTYLCFSGVTLISPNGLPYLKHQNNAVDAMFPKYRNSSDKYLKTVPYTYYVNVVQGSMTDINRQDKYIRLTNGNKYYYDILLLLLGKQYQHPDYLKPAMDEETTMRKDCSAYLRLDIPRRRIVPELVKYKTPDNVFIINDLSQANSALKYVKSTFSYDSNSIYIVYGATIDAYCCLTGLLEMDIPAKNIVFVEPFPSEDRYKTRISAFNNSNVDETVNNVIEKLHITVYRSYYFKSWTVNDDIVTEVEFLSTFHLAKLECTAFFYYGQHGVDTKAYLAINKCGMGYDGGILIDHKFRTKDPCIYAAGPCTAYYRRYFAMDKKQKYYDSGEVGQKLGLQIRNQYDPLFTEKPIEKARKSSVRFSTVINCDLKTDDKTNCGTHKSSIINESEKAIEKIPNFTNPKVIYCKLPGGLQFIEIRSPGKKVPHHYVHTLDYSGFVLETFKNGYFKLHLTNHFIVDGITCLTPEKYNLEIFRNLYGLPSAVLNNVYLKYVTKKVDNLFDFFRSTWAYFLYHDQCNELFAMVKELLPKGEADGDTVVEALHKIRMSISLSTRDSTVKNEIKKRFDATPHIQAISDYVIEWLAENDAIMPMYIQPSQRTDFLHDVEKSSVFKKRKTSITVLISKLVF